MNSCFIKGLENPNLNGILIGYEQDQSGRYVLPKKWPPCCKGMGTYLRERSVYRCDLRSRIKRVEDLFESMEIQTKFTKAPNFHDWNKNHEFFLRWLLRESPEGFSFNSRNKMHSPGILWSYAFLASYRFNVQCIVLRVERRNYKYIEKVLQLPLEPSAILFIEQVEHPVIPEAALVLEQVLSWAYNANLKVWLEYPNVAPTLNLRQIGKADFLGKLNQRLVKHTKQGLDHWLDPPTFSKLQTMCRQIQTKPASR